MLSTTEIKAIIAQANTLDELVHAEEVARRERFPSGVLNALISKRLDDLLSDQRHATRCTEPDCVRGRLR